ncbi:MAG: hypothetical protein EBY06_03165, partial [Burkholderiaceae bacterium]|nr:hypothetical protein [Burkholderiaceae bacterium]
EHFHPLPEAEVKAFKQSYFGENANKFIVGCVNRNQPRKDIPTTIFGFMEYWEEHNPNALLYLHMHPKDPMGWHLRNILGQTPLKEGEHFMFPPEEDCNKGAGFAFGLPFACLSNKSALLAFFIRKAICKPWRFAKSVFFSVMIKNPPSSHQTGL